MNQTGAPLAGVSIDLRGGPTARATVSDENGGYRFEGLPPGTYEAAFSLMNFGTLKLGAIALPDTGTVTANARLALTLSADVTVTGKGSFVNLADVEDARSEPGRRRLLGVAGRGHGRQLEHAADHARRRGARDRAGPHHQPAQRRGEGEPVLPARLQPRSRHRLRDHVAGVPVNMPTHAHGHGYSDVELPDPRARERRAVPKGPYFADQGDFSAAGAAHLSYANALDATARARERWRGRLGARAASPASPRVGSGHLLYALEVNRNDGPWTRPDDYRRVNGVLRYSAATRRTASSLTAHGLSRHVGRHRSGPAARDRCGSIDRFGFDRRDRRRRDRTRYSARPPTGSVRAPAADASQRAYVVRTTDLNLFSNFTYFLDDPVNGDQFEQARSPLRVGRTRQRIAGSDCCGPHRSQTPSACQLRNDDIDNVGLYRTARPARDCRPFARTT